MSWFDFVTRRWWSGCRGSIYLAVFCLGFSMAAAQAGATCGTGITIDTTPSDEPLVLKGERGFPSN